jgi:hypothetical protein
LIDEYWNRISTKLLIIGVENLENPYFNTKLPFLPSNNYHEIHSNGSSNLKSDGGGWEPIELVIIWV